MDDKISLKCACHTTKRFKWLKFLAFLCQSHAILKQLQASHTDLDGGHFIRVQKAYIPSVNLDYISSV